MTIAKTRTCEECGVEYSHYHGWGSLQRFAVRRFCSMRCAGIARRKAPVACTHCGEAYAAKSGQRYCSLRCYRLAHPTPDCKIDDCESKAFSRGLCQFHYSRERRLGNAMLGGPRRVLGDDLERFWSKVEKTPGCWLWTGAKGDHGYGVFNAGGTLIGAHRHAYILLVGSIPQDLFLDHLCSVRNCVNPAHLEPVTHAENMRRAIRPTCKRGHEWTEENSYLRPDNGMRICRTCAKMRQRARLRGRRPEFLVPRSIKQRVLDRDGRRCAYGGCEAHTIDHVVPIALRRVHKIAHDDQRYMVAACLTHNLQKGTRKLYPSGFDVTLLPGKGWREWHGDVESLRVVVK